MEAKSFPGMRTRNKYSYIRGAEKITEGVGGDQLRYRYVLLRIVIVIIIMNNKFIIIMNINLTLLLTLKE